MPKNKPKTTWIVTTVIALFAIVAGTYFSVREKEQATNSNAAADVSLIFNTPTLSSNINTSLTPRIVVNPTTNQVTAVEVNLSFDPAKMMINSITNSGIFAKTLKAPVIDNSAGTASFVYGIDVVANSTPVPVTTTSDVATINLTTKGVQGSAVLNIANTSIVTAKDVDTSVLGTYGTMTINIGSGGQTYPDWDVNSDGTVNIIDIGIVVDNYGSSTPTVARADVNGDDIINIIDIGIIVDNYQ